MILALAPRAAVVHLNFLGGSTFPVTVCTVSPGHWVNKAATQQGWLNLGQGCVAHLSGVCGTSIRGVWHIYQGVCGTSIRGVWHIYPNFA